MDFGFMALRFGVYFLLICQRQGLKSKNFYENDKTVT